MTSFQTDQSKKRGKEKLTLEWRPGKHHHNNPIVKVKHHQWCHGSITYRPPPAPPPPVMIWEGHFTYKVFLSQTHYLSLIMWCWRRLLRVPWTARRSNQSVLKEINPEYSLEGLMLKLKLQYFGHLMADSLEKTLMLGKIESRRQRVRCLDGITDSQTWVFRNSGR